MCFHLERERHGGRSEPERRPDANKFKEKLEFNYGSKTHREADIRSSGVHVLTDSPSGNDCVLKAIFC